MARIHWKAEKRINEAARAARRETRAAAAAARDGDFESALASLTTAEECLARLRANIAAERDRLTQPRDQEKDRG